MGDRGWDKVGIMATSGQVVGRTGRQHWAPRWEEVGKDRLYKVEGKITEREGWEGSETVSLWVVGRLLLPRTGRNYKGSRRDRH